MSRKKEVSEEKRELLEGIRPITKKGGYEEIPEELILEQAERVGLSSKDLPRIRTADVKGGYIERTSEGEVEIVIPRRQSKKVVPTTLRHELAHYKLGRVSSGGEISHEDWIKGELEVERLQSGGKLGSESLTSVVLTMVLEDKIPRRYATAWVMEEARKLGASEHSITSSKRWLKDYWKYLDSL